MTALLSSIAALVTDCFNCVSHQAEGVHSSWLTNVNGQDLSTAHPQEQWLVSVYYVLTTVTTVSQCMLHTTT
jgi:hypothetical protein